MRISLAGDPCIEIKTAWEILVSLGIREKAGPELIACPTCGRTEVDLLSMVEHSIHERAALRGTFRMVPDVYGSLMSCSGEYRYEPVDGGSIRTMRGEFRIKLPVVGGRAERVVVDNLRRQNAVVATMVDDWVG